MAAFSQHDGFILCDGVMTRTDSVREEHDEEAK
jgi:hypothetical protein